MPDVYDTGASLRTAIRRLQTILSTIYLRAARLRLTLAATPRQSSKPSDHAPTAVRFGNLPQLGVECNLETHRGDITATNPEIWRAWRDLNPQPSDPKSEALSG